MGKKCLKEAGEELAKVGWIRGTYIWRIDSEVTTTGMVESEIWRV